MSELPRLDDLIRLPDPAADDAYRVLDADFVDWRIHEHPHKV
jgi:hypothetical protein